MSGLKLVKNTRIKRIGSTELCPTRPQLSLVRKLKDARDEEKEAIEGSKGSRLPSFLLFIVVHVLNSLTRNDLKRKQRSSVTRPNATPSFLCQCGHRKDVKRD